MSYEYQPEWKRGGDGKVALVGKRQISVSAGSELIRLSPGSIIGDIISLNVPQVKSGEYIDITIAYNAYNPNGSFFNPWKIFLVAKDSIGNREMVKDVDVRDDEFSDSGTWRLWKMPGQSIQLEIRLYGHDEIVPWSWSWWS